MNHSSSSPQDPIPLPDSFIAQEPQRSPMVSLPTTLDYTLLSSQNVSMQPSPDQQVWDQCTTFPSRYTSIEHMPRGLLTPAVPPHTMRASSEHANSRYQGYPDIPFVAGHYGSNREDEQNRCTGRSANPASLTSPKLVTVKKEEQPVMLGSGFGSRTTWSSLDGALGKDFATLPIRQYAQPSPDRPSGLSAAGGEPHQTSASTREEANRNDMIDESGHRLNSQEIHSPSRKIVERDRQRVVADPPHPIPSTSELHPLCPDPSVHHDITVRADHAPLPSPRRNAQDNHIPPGSQTDVFVKQGSDGNEIVPKNKKKGQQGIRRDLNGWEK